MLKKKSFTKGKTLNEDQFLICCKWDAYLWTIFIGGKNRIDENWIQRKLNWVLSDQNVSKIHQNISFFFSFSFRGQLKKVQTFFQKVSDPLGLKETEKAFWMSGVAPGSMKTRNGGPWPSVQSSSSSRMSSASAKEGWFSCTRTSRGSLMKGALSLMSTTSTRIEDVDERGGWPPSVATTFITWLERVSRSSERMRRTWPLASMPKKCLEEESRS